MKLELSVDDIGDVETIVGVLAKNGYQVSVRQVPHKTCGFVKDHYEVEVEGTEGETDKEDNDHIDSDPIERVERIMAERRKLFGDQVSCKDIMEMIIGETE